MKFLFLYDFNGIEATFTVEADDLSEAESRVKAMGTAKIEGVIYDEIFVADVEMLDLTNHASVVDWIKNL